MAANDSAEASAQKNECQSADGRLKSQKKPGAPTTDNDRDVGDVTRLEVRIGLVKRVWEHPEADKLYCEEIDIGEEQPRSIASGLREHLGKADLENHKVLVLANMKPKPLRGFASHGMILCVSSGDGSAIELLQCPSDAEIGERVFWEGLSGEPDTVMGTKKGRDPFIAVKDFLKTGEDKVAYYKDKKFMTSKGPCFCNSLASGSIS